MKIKKILKILHVSLDIVLIIALVISVTLIIFTTFTPIKTLSIYKVLSGSMEPSIHVGSVVISKVVDAKDLNKNDIISYTELQNPGTIVTHRIINKKLEQNELIFNTKGDANNVGDLDDITQDRITGKVILSIPLLGYLLSWVKQPLGFFITIIVPALFIIITEIFNMKKTVEEEAVKKFTRKQSEPVNRIVTILLVFGLSLSVLFLDQGQTFSYFSSGRVLSGNVFSTSCWAPPTVPVLVYPENNSMVYKGSAWDLNPYMDWGDSTTECPDTNLHITYIYQSFTNEELTHLAYTSQPLSNSRIPAGGTPNNTYWWHVKACDSAGRCSKYSDVFKFTYNNSITEPTTTLLRSSQSSGSEESDEEDSLSTDMESGSTEPSNTIPIDTETQIPKPTEIEIPVPTPTPEESITPDSQVTEPELNTGVVNE